MIIAQTYIPDFCPSVLQCPPTKKSGIFLGNYHVKFGHFSRKYHIKFEHFVNLLYIYFRAKMSPLPKKGWLSSHAYACSLKLLEFRPTLFSQYIEYTAIKMKCVMIQQDAEEMFQSSPHFVLHVFEGLTDEVDRLEVLVVIFLYGRGARVKRQHLRLVWQRVFQFSERRQKSRTVRSQLTVLLAQPKLHREPVQLHNAHSFTYTFQLASNSSRRPKPPWGARPPSTGHVTASITWPLDSYRCSIVD